MNRNLKINIRINLTKIYIYLDCLLPTPLSEFKSQYDMVTHYQWDLMSSLGFKSYMKSHKLTCK